MKYHIQFDLSFVPNTYPGKYYALEGIDGSGKTTQVEKLAEYFRSQEKEVLLTKEPTDGVIGQFIQQVIGKEMKMPPMSLQYLFCADRGVHLEETVIPALKKGMIVISDRSFWSAVAYGIADLHLQEDERERLLVAYNVLALYGGYLAPDKTFVIDVPADVAMQRVIARKQGQTLYEKTATLAKVKTEYAWMAEKFKECLVRIDGTQNVENVFEEIIKNI